MRWESARRRPALSLLKVLLSIYTTLPSERPWPLPTPSVFVCACVHTHIQNLVHIKKRPMLCSQCVGWIQTRKKSSTRHGMVRTPPALLSLTLVTTVKFQGRPQNTLILSTTYYLTYTVCNNDQQTTLYMITLGMALKPVGAMHSFVKRLSGASKHFEHQHTYLFSLQTVNLKKITEYPGQILRLIGLTVWSNMSWFNSKCSWFYSLVLLRKSSCMSVCVKTDAVEKLWLFCQVKEK